MVEVAVEVVGGTVIEAGAEAVVVVAVEVVEAAAVGAVDPPAGEPAQDAVSRAAVSHQVSLRRPAGR